MKLERGMQVLVTGAASGIGRAAALARRAGTTAGRAPPQFDAVAALAGEIHAAHGPMDVLMNVAGVALFGLVEDMQHADWKRVIDVNLWGTIHVIECFLPAMIVARRGHVVNIASLAGLAGLPWHAAYSTSKWGVVGLSEVLRCDLRQHGIGITVVCPGAVDTPMKHSAAVLGVDPSRPDLLALRQRFDRQAVSPETVARMACEAIERNRFLVVTSWDVRILHFCKRHLSPLYHLAMISVSNLLNRLRT